MKGPGTVPREWHGACEKIGFMEGALVARARVGLGRSPASRLSRADRYRTDHLLLSTDVTSESPPRSGIAGKNFTLPPGDAVAGEFRGCSDPLPNGATPVRESNGSEHKQLPKPAQFHACVDELPDNLGEVSHSRQAARKPGRHQVGGRSLVDDGDHSRGAEDDHSVAAASRSSSTSERSLAPAIRPSERCHGSVGALEDDPGASHAGKAGRPGGDRPRTRRTAARIVSRPREPSTTVASTLPRPRS